MFIRKTLLELCRLIHFQIPEATTPLQAIRLMVFILIFGSSSFHYSFAGPAQILPSKTTNILRVYTTTDYNSGPQNRVVLQHSSGLIYVGNNEGLLEYDGIKWRKYPVPDHNIWSLAEDSKGRLFIGGSYGRIGIMEPDSIGRLTYRQLNHDLKLGAVYDITSIGDTLYFHPQFSLLQWDGSQLKTLIADTSKLFPDKKVGRVELFPGFNVGGRAVVRENRRQLKQINRQVLTPHKFGLFNIPLKVQSITPFKGGQLLATAQSGFWLYEENRLTNLFPEKTAAAKQWTISNGVVLPDSTIAYCTREAGILFFDPIKGTLTLLDENDGLPSNKCLALTLDNEGNIWAAMESGIVKIDYGLSATLINSSAGLDGIILSVVRFNERMYAATSSGLFELNAQSQKWQKPVGYPGELNGIFTWDFLNANQKLLIATSEGLYIKPYNQDTYRKLDGLSPRSYKLFRSRKDSNRVYVFDENVVSSIYHRAGKWTVEKSPLANVPARARKINEDKSGRLWIVSSIGAYSLEPNLSNMDKPADPSSSGKIPTAQDVLLNLPNANAYAFLLTAGDSIFVSNADSIYAVDHRDGSLVPSNSFKDIENVYREKWPPYTAPDSNTMWWHSKGKYLKSALKTDQGNRYLTNPLNSVIIPKLNDIYFEADQIWFSTSDGVIRYEPERVPFNYPEKRPLIRRLEEIDGETLRENLTTWPQQISLRLSSERNNLRFSVADAAYIGNRDTEYQFKLSPQSTSWSNWTTEYTKDYTFLYHGEYTFSVRMKNDFDQISEPVHYSFIIHPPWYLHPLAYVFYTIIGIFLLIGMVLYSRRRGFAKAEKVYLKRELQSAVDTQRSLIPEKFPKLDGFSLAGYYSPAADVGGDHYDAIPVGSDQSMLISLADIEGKRMEGAVPATLLNGLLNGAIRNSTFRSLVEIALRIDSLFYTKLKGERRVAIFMAMLRENQDIVRLFNAGCYPPLHLSGGKAIELKSDSLINAPLGNGMAERGLSSLSELSEHQILLNKGESLILYSDGVRGLKDRAGNKLFAKLCEDIQGYSGNKNASEIRGVIINTINEAIRNGASQTDDITFIVIQRTSN